jgi:hypothetical protein
MLIFLVDEHARTNEDGDCELLGLDDRFMAEMGMSWGAESVQGVEGGYRPRVL